MSMAADEGVVPRLQLSGITKAFGTVRANAGVSLSIAPGTIHGLIGENGAGKSTLVKIAYGLLRPDSGEIRVDGVPMVFDSPFAARCAGVGLVFQHFSLFVTLTVAENIALGTDWHGARRELTARIAAIGERYELALNPDRPVYELSMGERQRIEIVRALMQTPRVLILDEPTSVLTAQETDRLFRTLRALAANGVSIVFISHKLDEVRDLCSVATILRHGRVAATCDPGTVPPEKIAELMVGGALAAPTPRKRQIRIDGREPQQILRLRGLKVDSPDPHGVSLSRISIDVHAGEIAGIAGIAGNGQNELMAALTGELAPYDIGQVRFERQPIGHLGPQQRRALGIAFVPEERIGQGTLQGMTLTENAVLTAPGRLGLTGGGLIRWGKVRAFAKAVRERFDVRAPSVDVPASSLSGGNLQKFMVGREIGQAPKLLVAANPTWGVDAAAARTIHDAIRALADRGAGVLLLSQDLDELMVLCDTLGVLHRGQISRVLPVREWTAAEVGLAMTGRGATIRAAAA